MFPRRLPLAVSCALVAVAAACSTTTTGNPLRVAPGPTDQPPFLESTRHPPTTPGRGSGTSTTTPADEQLPTDTGPLAPGGVADQCLLTAVEFSALTGLRTTEGSNEARSCGYVSDGRSAGRITVYGTFGTTPAELVRRLIHGLAGSRSLAGVGLAAVIAPTTSGAELWVATDRYLVRLHTTGAPPQDSAWLAAGVAAVNRLPAG